MAEYISSFTTGFGEVIAKNIHLHLKGVDVVDVYDGLIHYRYNGNPIDINRVFYFNNSFLMLRFFKGKQITFNRMVSDVSSKKLQYLKANGTFRIRFSQSNQFAKVDKNITLNAEAAVSRATHMRIDRLNPTTEMWYIIRDEGFGFYGQLLNKRTATEKNLNKGELRPEFAYLMCCSGDIKRTSVIIDPFAGFGSIPLQIKKHFPFKHLIVNDNEKDKVNKLRKSPLANDSRIQIICKDALALSDISNESIDTIITDPPWGYYENIENIEVFYEKMFEEFIRISKKDGSMVVLSARKDEFQVAVNKYPILTIVKSIHTLVNGKKAAVFILKRKPHEQPVL